MNDAPQELYPLILDSITEGVFTVDSEFRITSFNAEAETITGFSRQQALGHKCYEVLRASICQRGCAIRKSLETGEPQRNVRVTVLNPDMQAVPICVSSAALRDAEGRMIGGVEIFRDISEVEALRSELSGRHVFGDMIGASAAMQEIFRLIPDVAPTDASVLIDGASGTGKELVARALHEQSLRRDNPFVCVNCGALPDTLLESELFGYVRGAFTGARGSKPGRFQQADGGTLFLDEVGELSPAFQVKLLRVLQEGEVQPLGGTETLRVDVRTIAATNRDLRGLVKEGNLREDLYYRLCVIPIFIPPLRERREDIIPLLEHFMSRLTARTGKTIREISPAALTALYDYDYPGNVRELSNILERAFVLCHEEEIDLTHLPPEVATAAGKEPTQQAESHGTTAHSFSAETGGEAATASRPAGDTPGVSPVPGQEPWRLKPSERKLLSSPVSRSDGVPYPSRRSSEQGHMRPEVQRLLDALDVHGWNRGATAAALRISRSTLWRRMKDYGLI
ncbi:MAG: sigma 54-interacting transcriptional regulator [Deltaproteobacteria bacterium]|nr:sigma 54-interacting transcriptional regulator [Deltaproteobacteria bacterium]